MTGNVRIIETEHDNVVEVPSQISSLRTEQLFRARAPKAAARRNSRSRSVLRARRTTEITSGLNAGDHIVKFLTTIIMTEHQESSEKKEGKEQIQLQENGAVKKSRSRMMVWIIAAFILVAAVGGGLYWYVSNKTVYIDQSQIQAPLISFRR